MHLEADYRKAYEEECQVSMNHCVENTPEEKERTAAEIELIKKMASLKEEETRKILNKEKRELVEAIYKGFEAEAYIQGGKITMDLNEDTMMARLIYTSKHFCKTDQENDISGNLMALVFQKSDMASILAKDDTFILDASFELYDRIKVADRSKEISMIKAAFKAKWNSKTARRNFQNE